MTNLFLGFLNRSLSAAVLIFAVVLVRLVFKKAPKWLLCALWALAAVRLLCPFSIESVLSLIPSAEPVQPEIVYSAAPAITSGIPAVDAIVNPPLQAAFTPDPAQSANPLQILTELAAWVWLGGCAVLVLYAAISALHLRLRVCTAVRLEGTCSSRNSSRPRSSSACSGREFICPSGWSPARRTWFWRTSAHI